MTIVTVFASRLRPGAETAYAPVAADMETLADTMDGFLDRRAYVDASGERVSIIRFRDLESQRAWATQVAHVAAQQRGRDEFYEYYDISVCEQLRSHRFDATESPAPR